MTLNLSYYLYNSNSKRKEVTQITMLERRRKAKDPFRRQATHRCPKALSHMSTAEAVQEMVQVQANKIWKSQGKLIHCLSYKPTHPSSFIQFFWVLGPNAVWSSSPDISGMSSVQLDSDTVYLGHIPQLTGPALQGFRCSGKPRLLLHFSPAGHTLEIPATHL